MNSIELQKQLFKLTQKTLETVSMYNFALKGDLSLDAVYKYTKSNGKLTTIKQLSSIAKANGLQISFKIEKGEK